MTSQSRFFVFIYPKNGEICSLLNLAVFALSPREKWPAHITVAGPFERRPRARAQPKFEQSVFSLGVANFFASGLNTVFLKVGMNDIMKYWNKPNFIGNPVPHLSLYNGNDEEFAQELFRKVQALRPIFSFNVSGIDVINSTAQRQTNLRELVDTNILFETKGMSLDEVANLPSSDRIEIASLALEKCKPIHESESELFGLR